MDGQIISRDRIRQAAEQAVHAGRLADCPPEFTLHKAAWLQEYQRAIREAAHSNETR